jgi:hypothetical protein
MNTIFIYLIIFFLGAVPIINLSVSQEETLAVVSNSNIGLEFKFPASWVQEDRTDIKKCDSICSMSLKIPADEGRPVVIVSFYNLNNPLIQSGCTCNTLKDFIKWEYEDPFLPKDLKSMMKNMEEIVSDKPTSIGNISGWEMESKVNLVNGPRQFYDFWTLQGDAGYNIGYAANEGTQYQKYLPEVKKMIQTFEFIPIEKRKTPSFLQ